VLGEFCRQADQKGSFKSICGMKKFPIAITHHGFLRAGDQLFAIPRIFQESEMETKPEVEVPRFLAWLKAWQSAMKDSLLVLLRRGADWKKIRWPQPFLFTAVRALDGDLVRCLVALGANVNDRMLREVKDMDLPHNPVIVKSQRLKDCLAFVQRCSSKLSPVDRRISLFERNLFFGKFVGRIILEIISRPT
jgi:hypothetical protein